MSSYNRKEDTWEEFWGSSTELMPSIMGAFDVILGHEKTQKDVPKRTYQSNTFMNLSPGVQKLLSNIPDQDINKNFSSEENLGSKKCFPKPIYRSFRRTIHKSNDSLEVISVNVQKMLSNLPDNELVSTASNINNHDKKLNHFFISTGKVSTSTAELSGTSLCDSAKTVANNENCGVCDCGKVQINESKEDCRKPLGSYLHTSPDGIASRMPVGRKNMGKHLQVPSESSLGTTSSTNSSEVSRPVSLTSLGSCSSSGSSGPNQVESAYLASAESLDSDVEPTGSQGSADSGIAEQPVMSPELRVLQEVLDTETVYVSDLKEVIEGYMEPWQSDPECPLTPYLQELFSNIKEIHAFNTTFLNQLRNAECDSTKTANVFLQNDSGFSVYNEYCTNYPRTMEAIGKLTSNEKMVPLFREKQMALRHALPLGSYLLKPVQRILKYHLLLQRLSKQCETEHKCVVDSALTTMTGIASDINMMKRKHEYAVRVQEIQSQLYGWNGPHLTALGELNAEGTFRVIGARGRRHVFLFDKMFLMAKSKQDGVLAYKSHIMCSNLMLVEQVRGEPLSFQVLPFDNPRHQCTLKARSPQHKREWTLQIKRTILENYNVVIPKHARQLVMQLGQDLHETDDTTEKWSPLKLNHTPHYLERRSRVTKTGDFSNRRSASHDRTFSSLRNWRRKSEPSMIPQYTTKVIPQKIDKMKKDKGGSKFYMDLSDCEYYDTNTICESTESLDTSNPLNSQYDSQDTISENSKMDLEKIVSDIVIEEFKKLKRSRRNLRDSEPSPKIWFEDLPKLPTKSDSLPRSFQLNDRMGSSESNIFIKHILEKSLEELPDHNLTDQLEKDLNMSNENLDFPDHKIYRKSTVKVSLQRYLRNLLPDPKKAFNYPACKQGSKSMGEKLANPDYVDPQKLFCCSQNSSLDKINLQCDTMEELDMTINEKDVLTEIDNRLQETGKVVDPTSSLASNLDQKISEEAKYLFNSSQPDSYYESILDDSLQEEYVRDSGGKLILKQDSFRNNENRYIFSKSTPHLNIISMKTTFKEQLKDAHSNNADGEIVGKRSAIEKKLIIRRPTIAPPPIPAKPKRLLNGTHTSTKTEAICKIDRQFITNVDSISHNESVESFDDANAKSWVKAMVVRFE